MGGIYFQLFKAARASTLITLTGCATIFGQSQYPISVNSTPHGAIVDVVDERGVQVSSGTTPTTISLRSGESYFTRKSYVVTVKKDGFSPQTTSLRSEIQPWYWANILLGGLIGMLIVDPISGAMYELEPRSVNVTLPATKISSLSTSESTVTPESIAQPATEDDLTSQLHALKKLKSSGVLSQKEYDDKKREILKTY